MPGRAKPPSLAHTTLVSPFERFEKFARAIFAVPKEEIDAKLAEYEKRKRKRRRKAA